MSDDLWADFGAAPLNVWIGEPEFGLWCPVCKLPSGWRATLGLDPTADEGGGLYGCTDVQGHGNAVRDQDER